MPTRRFLRRSERFLRVFLETAVVLLLSAIVVICFVEVVLRYGLGSSFGWYDEFTGYLLVWLTFMGAVLAQHERRHIGVAPFDRRLSPAWRARRRSLIHLLLAAVHLVILYYGFELAARFLAERAITLPVPMGILYAVLPFSAVLMLAMQALQWIEERAALRDGEPVATETREA